MGVAKKKKAEEEARNKKQQEEAAAKKQKVEEEARKNKQQVEAADLHLVAQNQQLMQQAWMCFQQHWMAWQSQQRAAHSQGLNAPLPPFFLPLQPEQRQLRLVVQVATANGTFPLKVYDGDDAEEVAQIFCKKHKMGERIICRPSLFFPHLVLIFPQKPTLVKLLNTFSASCGYLDLKMKSSQDGKACKRFKVIRQPTRLTHQAR